MHVQVSLEDSIHKSKKVYCNYEENYKYERTYMDDSSDQSDHSEQSGNIKNKKLLKGKNMPFFNSMDQEDNVRTATPEKKNYI